MADDSLVGALLQQWPAVLVVAFSVYLVSNRFNRGLNKYPGPFLASLTDWWRFWDVYKRRPEVTHINLHAKHGDVLRLGPNTLSFANPKALKTIYGLNKGFTKVTRTLRSVVWRQGLTKVNTVGILPSPNVSGRRPQTSFTLQHHI